MYLIMRCNNNAILRTSLENVLFNYSDHSGINVVELPL